MNHSVFHFQRDGFLVYVIQPNGNKNLGHGRARTLRARSHEQFFFAKFGSIEKKICRCELKHVTKSH